MDGCFPYLLPWHIFLPPLGKREVTEVLSSTGTQEIFEREFRDGFALVKSYRFESGRWTDGYGKIEIPAGYDPANPAARDEDHIEWELSEYAAGFPALPGFVVKHVMWKDSYPDTFGSRVTSFEMLSEIPNANALFEQLTKGMLELGPGEAFDVEGSTIFAPGGASRQAPSVSSRFFSNPRNLMMSLGGA